MDLRFFIFMWRHITTFNFHDNTQNCFIKIHKFKIQKFQDNKYQVKFRSIRVKS